MSDINVEIGKRIFEKRKKKGLSRDQLLEHVNISEVYLGMIERGKRGTSIEHMVQIADALGMSMDYMILGKEKEFDKSDSIAKDLQAMGTEERKLIESFVQRIKVNLISENKLKTVLELIELFVAYEGRR